MTSSTDTSKDNDITITKIMNALEGIITVDVDVGWSFVQQSLNNLQCRTLKFNYGYV